VGGGDFLARGLAARMGELLTQAGPDAERWASVFAGALGRVGMGFLIAGLSSGALSTLLASSRFFPTDSDDGDDPDRAA